MNVSYWKTKILYKRDDLFSKGTPALIGALAAVSAIVVLFLSLVVWLFRITTEASLSDQLWEYSMIVLKGDPTNGAPWAYRLTTQIIVYVGIFFTSVLIGIFATSIKGKIDELRKGRSLVIEKNHILILGWSDDITTIISELIEANESEKKSCVVVLSEKSKVAMEDKISSNISDRGSTKIVCRSGSPIEMRDLQIVSPQTTKAIIILAERGELADIKVIKTILALVNDPARRRNPYHIIAQLNNKKYFDLAENVGKSEVSIVHTSGVISKIAVQSCRQPGLASVYADLLDYAGDEIYVKEEQKLIGKTFGGAMFAYEESSLIGLVRDKVILNPSIDEVIAEGDKVVVIASDDSNIHLSKKSVKIDESYINGSCAENEKAENVLILGWNESADYIISELNEFASAGSTLIIAGDSPEITSRVDDSHGMSNQNVNYLCCDITDKASLNKLDFSEIHRVMILACNDQYSREECDARTLITLLLVRNIKDNNGYEYSIVGEILDTVNRDLLTKSKISDFLISEQLVGLTISQIAEQKMFADIFKEIFQADGSEIYFKPISNYIKNSKSMDFYTILKSAQMQNEIAIGYRHVSHRHDPKLNYGIKLNPNKSEVINFNKEDMIIVFSEN